MDTATTTTGRAVTPIPSFPSYKGQPAAAAMEHDDETTDGKWMD